jgi:hypothetical protein
MNMNPPRRDTVHALALQHFAFLLEEGFVLQPEDKSKQRLRGEDVRYRRQQWEIDLYLEYFGGFYHVSLVPLLDGKPRPGYPTGYALLKYLVQYQGIEDEEVTSLAEHQRHTQALLTVEYAEDILARYARILARYLDQIMVAAPPPVERLMPLTLGETHLTALRELQQGLGAADVRWVLTGGAGLALQGVPIPVLDLDVQTDAAGAYEIARRFAPAVIDPIHLWDSGSMRSQ